MPPHRLPPLTFRARSVKGAGRGRKLGTPTINVDMSDVPPDLANGIYVCRAAPDDGKVLDAVMHYGPRPVFKDPPACEVHLLDLTMEEQPAFLTVEIIGWLRDVRDFPSPDDLRRQIAQDIVDARAMLGALS